MTETSPVASVGHIKSTLADALDDDELADLRTTVGHAARRRRLPRRRPGPTSSRCRGTARPSGELQVRGPWIAAGVLQRRPLARVVHRRRLAQDRRRRHRRRRRLHPPRRPHQGRREVRRRVDQLGRARERDHGPPEGGRGRRDRRAAPEVGRAAAGLRRAAKEGETVDEGGAASPSSSGRVAKWWLPDDVVFIDEVPKTTVGKFSKKDLREPSSRTTRCRRPRRSRRTGQKRQRVVRGARSSSVPNAYTVSGRTSYTPYGGGPAVGAPKGASKPPSVTVTGHPYLSR